jgi:hypothetical protein
MIIVYLRRDTIYREYIAQLRFKSKSVELIRLQIIQVCSLWFRPKCMLSHLWQITINVLIKRYPVYIYHRSIYWSYMIGFEGMAKAHWSELDMRCMFSSKAVTYFFVSFLYNFYMIIYEFSHFFCWLPCFKARRPHQGPLKWSALTPAISCFPNFTFMCMSKVRPRRIITLPSRLVHISKRFEVLTVEYLLH